MPATLTMNNNENPSKKNYKMKIKKFNESIEWLDGETIKLIDLTGPVKSTKNTHRKFVKIEFERGALCFQGQWGRDAENLNLEFKVDISNSVKYHLDTLEIDDVLLSQDPKIPEKYKFAILIHEYDGGSRFFKYFGVFDLKGNLVFFSKLTCENISLFGDILTLDLGGNPTLINLKTHESHIRHK